MTERDEQIAALFRDGKGQREISRIVGISQPAVRKHLLKAGLIPSPDNHKRETSAPVSQPALTVEHKVVPATPQSQAAAQLRRTLESLARNGDPRAGGVLSASARPSEAERLQAARSTLWLVRSLALSMKLDDNLDVRQWGDEILEVINEAGEAAKKA